MAKLDLEIPRLKLNDESSIPMLGFGTGTAMYKPDDGKINHDTVSQISTAIKLGYRHLDGAEMYNTEPELGRAIKDSKVPREEFYVTTKVHRNIKDIPGALDSSLKKLGLDYVDLYLIHQPFFAKSESELQDAWKAMEQVQRAGKAKSIGVSNFLQSHLETILKTAEVTPTINQIEYHPYLQHANLVPWCQAKGIAIEAYGPATGAVRAKPGPCDETLAALAKKYAVNEADVLLRWCIDQNIIPITTSSKEQRMSDYLRAVTFQLTPREVEELKNKGSEKHYRGFWGKEFDPNDKS